MIIICGKTIAEVERDLEMAKQAIASGMPYGVGGATIEDAEKGLEMMRSMMGGAVAPIDNPNYVGVPPIEDDEYEICPVCDNYWDGCYCEHCGYPDTEEDEDEDEIVPPAVAALVEMLRYLGADEDTINKLLS